DHHHDPHEGRGKKVRKRLRRSHHRSHQLGGRPRAGHGHHGGFTADEEHPGDRGEGDERRGRQRGPARAIHAASPCQSNGAKCPLVRSGTPVHLMPKASMTLRTAVARFRRVFAGWNVLSMTTHSPATVTLSIPVTL